MRFSFWQWRCFSCEYCVTIGSCWIVFTPLFRLRPDRGFGKRAFLVLALNLVKVGSCFKWVLVIICYACSRAPRSVAPVAVIRFSATRTALLVWEPHPATHRCICLPPAFLPTTAITVTIQIDLLQPSLGSCSKPATTASTFIAHNPMCTSTTFTRQCRAIKREKENRHCKKNKCKWTFEHVLSYLHNLFNCKVGHFSIFFLKAMKMWILFIYSDSRQKESWMLSTWRSRLHRVVLLFVLLLLEVLYTLWA